MFFNYSLSGTAKTAKASQYISGRGLRIACVSPAIPSSYIYYAGDSHHCRIWVELWHPNILLIIYIILKVLFYLFICCFTLFIYLRIKYY